MWAIDGNHDGSDASWLDTIDPAITQTAASFPSAASGRLLRIPGAHSLLGTSRKLPRKFRCWCFTAGFWSC